MATTHRSRVLIIGSGPAGYSAAIYAARANLEPIMVQGLEPGGQLTITTDVENYPGFADIVQGPWLMEQMAGQAQAVGTRLIHDMVVAADFSKRPFVCAGDSGDFYVGDTVIVCTGAQAKWLGLESEQRFMGFGVSACATCDGFFFRGKEVAVIGGGNTAVEEALYLTNHASRSPSSTAATRSAPRRFCRTACSATTRSRSCGTTSWPRSKARASRRR